MTAAPKTTRVECFSKRENQWNGKRYVTSYTAQLGPITARAGTESLARTEVGKLVTETIEGWREPTFLTLGDTTAIVFAGIYSDGLNWCLQLIGPDGPRRHTSRSTEKGSAIRSALNAMTQDYCAVDWWDRDRIEHAAEWAERHGGLGQDGNGSFTGDDVRSYASFQRAHYYAVSIGEPDPHQWTFDKRVEFLERWDRPESVAS